MKDSRPHPPWRAVALGAIDGFVIGVAAFAALRYLPDDALSALTGVGGGASFPSGSDLFKYQFIPPLATILFAVSSLLVHKYLAGRLKSIFLLWQCVGALAVAGALLMSVLILIDEHIDMGRSITVSRLLSSEDLRLWAWALIVVAIWSAIYAHIVRVPLLAYSSEITRHK